MKLKLKMRKMLCSVSSFSNNRLKGEIRMRLRVEFGREYKVRVKSVRENMSEGKI